MRRATLLIAFAALALLPGPAQASQSQESLFEDEVSLLYSGAERRDQTLDELRDLGVDVIRANVIWNRYAQSPRSKIKPSFDAADPNAYPLGEVDALVAGAPPRGVTALLTPTAPAPAGASTRGGPATARRICSPRPAGYGDFVEALGKRYPAVTRWSFYNEPNQGGWLTPQWKKSGGTHIPAAPAIYRNLVRAGTAALDASGHGGDQILLGETPPIGRTSGRYSKRSLAPGDFYRELFCLDKRGRKLRGKAARIRGCTTFKRLEVTGIAHHPYTRGAGQSLGVHVGSADITLTHISRLTTLINRAAHQR